MDRKFFEFPLLICVKAELFLPFLQVKKFFEESESIEFAGRCVVALAADPKIMDKSGSLT